jgi:hypothetical protein
VDIDVLALDDPAHLAQSLQDEGYVFDRKHKEFVQKTVPVHIVTVAQVGMAPTRFVDIDGIRTITLADLINIKLRSGLSNVLRAQDLADVIALIRTRRLRSAFAAKIDKSLRVDFRELVRAVKREKRS